MLPGKGIGYWGGLMSHRCLVPSAGLGVCLYVDVWLLMNIKLGLLAREISGMGAQGVCLDWGTCRIWLLGRPSGLETAWDLLVFTSLWVHRTGHEKKQGWQVSRLSIRPVTGGFSSVGLCACVALGACMPWCQQLAIHGQILAGPSCLSPSTGGIQTDVCISH